MPTNQQIPLGRFRLDLTNECLWQGTEVITLRPKVYAVLKHLVDHRGQLVTKQQLLDAVWPGTFVGDAVVKGIIRQLREALGDDAESPEFIQTAPRRGYRFVGRTSEESVVAPQVEEVSRRVAALDVVIPSGSSAPSPPREVLGRDAELATLRSRLDRALAGERQVVFVTGEAGIGKTALVDSLLHQAATHGIRMARGQCLDQYGAGEAYLPILDALSRLGRGPGGESVVACLRQFAPAWLLELPSLVGPEEGESGGGHHARGATRERMLREIAEAIEAMTTEAPLIIVIEDLHWSDYSTLDLIAYLARRNDPARLMVIGTYRPVEVIVGEHPLKSVKRELQAHGLCLELPLGYLTEEAVAQYLNVTLPGNRLERRLARLIYKRTEGNPLFMVNLVDYLIDEGLIVKIDGAWQLQGAYAAIESGVPDSVRQLIEKHIERLSPDERTVLEGASVVGMECSAVAIGAGLERPTEWVEERCEALVRRHRFLSPSQLVELPDGTMTPRYTFSHILYLEVPYRLLPAMRRAQIHLRIGAAGEAFYLSRVREIAAELAMHFEQGRDHPRAVKYLLQAAENARYRSAHHEAAALARRGLQAVETLPPSTERDEQELGLRLILGVAIMTLKGFAAEEVKDIVNPALELCARHRASFKAFMVQWLLGYFHYFRGEIELCRKIVVLLMDRAEGVGEPHMLVEGHRASGIVLVELGRYEDALEHFDQVSALYDPDRYGTRAPFAGLHPKVVSDCFAARALWLLGYPDQALTRVERGMSLAQAVGHAESLILAMHVAAHLHQLRGEARLSQDRAETVIAVSDEHGLTMWAAFGHLNRGWARIEQGYSTEGIQELRDGLSACESTGTRIWRAHFVGLLAQALASAGQIQEAQVALARVLALVADTGENWPAAELYRLQGEFALAQGVGGERWVSTGAWRRSSTIPPRVATQAANSFRRALTIAREQQARSWELRVLASLSRVRLDHEITVEPHRGLRATYDSFSEGHNTADLREALAVLSHLQTPS
jgi:DNA-binding winged helix-turn-helix (wHTH) protein/predicted ATPase